MSDERMADVFCEKCQRFHTARISLDADGSPVTTMLEPCAPGDVLRGLLETACVIFADGVEAGDERAIDTALDAVLEFNDPAEDV